MPTTSLMPTAKQQYFAFAGIPLVGGKVYTFAAGGVAPKATYTDADGTVAQANPIVLNARGEPDNAIFWSGAYNIKVTDALGNVIYTVDNYQTPVMAGDLAGTTVNAGAGMIGFLYATAYGVGTLGRWLQDLATSAGSSFMGFIQAGAGAVLRSVQTKLRETVSVRDFGAVGDGVADDTIAIQAAIDFAAGMFNQVSFPPAGAAYNSPIVMFPPGAYRITNTLNVYVGLTLTGQSSVPNTVEHTRLIMDTVGGTVNLNKHILNLTSTFQAVARSNNVTVSIQDLGFWTTNPGSTITARGGTGWTVDANGIGNGGTGCHIYCAEPLIDTRIRRCSFYSVPNASIWINQANTTKSSDLEVVDCEFDTSVIGVRFSSGNLTARLKHNQFYAGSYHVHVQDSIGTLAIQGGIMQYSSRIKVNSATGLDLFAMNGVVSDGASSLGTWVELNKAKQVNINGCTAGVCAASTFYVVDADGGVISGNSITNSGYNAAVSAGATDPGAIRLLGCQNVVVTGNPVTTPSAAAYGGFGIVAHTNGGRTTKCIIAANNISASYTGASYRGQSRRLNVETTDTIINNETNVSADDSIELASSGGTRYIKRVAISVTGNVDIPLDPLTQGTANFAMCAVSSAANFGFAVQVIKSPFSGVYVISDIAKNNVAAAGLGPHTISAGNTVTFSISGTNLRLAFAITTDTITYAGIISGAR